MSIWYRIGTLVDTYVIARMTGRLSNVGFWYTEARARVIDELSLARYLSSKPSPPYLIDYRGKTSWPLTDSTGIIQLPYPAPIGCQHNPEAAFQTALGWHDLYLESNSLEAREHFLRYARTYLSQQTDEGDFPYLFDYFEFKAPWSSALAQSRGASVMLRAYLLTKDNAFAESARAALSKFGVMADQGGYRHDIVPGRPMFEEYPRFGHFTLNGFMVALMGCYEVAHWLDDRQAKELWDIGLETLNSEGQRFFLPWWTLYDLDNRGRLSNVNSPFYHQMIRGYFEVLVTLGGGSEIQKMLDRTVALDRWPNRARATLQKAARKIMVR